MVKLFQMLQGNAEYFGLLLTKSGDPQSYSKELQKEYFYFSVP